MKELADWLTRIEGYAEDFYAAAAGEFKRDEQFAGFLQHLAEEEQWHRRVIGSVSDRLARDNGIAAAIALDSSTKEKIEAPFLACSSRLKSHMLTKEHAVDCIVAAEFSEWNDIFVYVVGSLKEAGQEFAFTASKMQAHKRHIERFIASLPGGGTAVAAMRRLPPVWHARILIVEDEVTVLSFLADVLSAEATVETAKNGTEALDKVKAKYFDVVLSDVDMPVMNGIEFFKEASLTEPKIAERFLFMTGKLTNETEAFFKKHHLRYLTKPMPIDEIEGAVTDILDKLPQTA
jgi:CheY-like chemotaxis protein